MHFGKKPHLFPVQHFLPRSEYVREAGLCFAAWHNFNCVNLTLKKSAFFSFSCSLLWSTPWTCQLLKGQPPLCGTH
jgi:hypothetical protein